MLNKVRDTSGSKIHNFAMFLSWVYSILYFCQFPLFISRMTSSEKEGVSLKGGTTLCMPLFLKLKMDLKHGNKKLLLCLNGFIMVYRHCKKSMLPFLCKLNVSFIFDRWQLWSVLELIQ